jgi:hypothetical protein
LGKLIAALNDGGILTIIDNRPNEKATLFQFKENSINVLQKINGGTDIETLAMNIFAKNFRNCSGIKTGCRKPLSKT